MMRQTLAVLAALIFMASQSARAEPVKASGDPEATVVDELVVTNRAAGPAWWRITRGQSVVWVLGAPRVLPRGFRWDTRPLNAHLAGANRVITPAVATANLSLSPPWLASPAG
jgi:hypothetical protein